MFEPGHKKMGGKKKGSQHKPKAAVREIIEKALGGSIPERLLDLAKGKPDFEADVLLALMPYCYPKLASVEHSGEVGNPDTSDSVRELTAELMKISGVK